MSVPNETLLGMHLVEVLTKHEEGRLVEERTYVRLDRLGTRRVGAMVKSINDHITFVHVEWSVRHGSKWVPTAWNTTKSIGEMRRALVNRGRSIFGSGGAA